MKHFIRSLAFMIAIPVLSQGSKPTIIPNKEIGVAGINIGASQKLLTRRFGKPIQVWANPDPHFGDTELEVQYKGVKAYFCDKRLVHLICINKRYCTPKKLHVGMSASEAIVRYGEPEKQSDSNETRFIYRSHDRETALVLHIKANTISSIELWCDYT